MFAFSLDDGEEEVDKSGLISLFSGMRVRFDVLERQPDGVDDIVPPLDSCICQL